MGFFWQLESAHVSVDIRSHSQMLSSHLGWPPLLRLLRQEAWASAIVYSTRLSLAASRVLFRVNDPLFFYCRQYKNQLLLPSCSCRSPLVWFHNIPDIFLLSPVPHGYKIKQDKTAVQRRRRGWDSGAATMAHLSPWLSC